LEPGRERRIVTAALVLAVFLSALEATAVGTAMPTVVADLGGMTRYSWVFSAYLLTSTTTVPLFGKLADLFGRRFALAPVSATRFRALDASFDAEVEFEGEGLDGPRSVRLLIEGQPPDTLAEVEVASPGADQLAGYVGQYDSAELQVTYEFVLEGGHLTVRHRNAPQEPLKPVVDDMFYVGGQTFHFSRDGQGRVSGFTVSTGRVRNVRFLRRG